MSSDPIQIKPSTLGKRKPRADILFFGEAAGEEESKRGLAFVGPAGEVLRDVIREEFPGLYCVLDNTVPLWLGSINDKPDAKLRNKWKQYRLDRIEQVKPRVIVLLGAQAMAGMGVKGQVTRKCGAVEYHDGIPMVCSVHPSYVLRGGSVGLLQRAMRTVHSCLQRKPAGGFRRVDDLTTLASLLRKCAKLPCAFDLETRGLKPCGDGVLTAAVTFGKHKSETFWTPLFHPETYGTESASKWETIRAWWPKGPRIVQNLKFECAWLDAPDPPELYDTMIQAFLLDENAPRNLNSLVTNYLRKPPYWESVEKHKKDLTVVPVDEIGEYNAQDTYHTWMLHRKQTRDLTPKQRSLSVSLFGPLAAELDRMEKRGLFINRRKLATLKRDNDTETEKALTLVRKEFPDLRNPNSVPQIRELLFDQLGLKPMAFTEKRLAKADEETILALAKKEPRLQSLSLARKHQGLDSRVYSPWLRLSGEDSRIHTTFGLPGALTGRLTSSGPNIQNIERGAPIRECIVSRHKGGKLVQIDYSQHELRIYAARAGDRILLDAFRKGKDPHQETATAIQKLGVKCDRSKAKNINFSVIYDISPEGLYARYAIPIREGMKLLPSWHKTHPWLEAFWQGCEKSIRRYGYVENMFGMRRHLKSAVGHEKRQGYNFPIQSEAVLICYFALLEIADWLRRTRKKSEIIHQIHDSIVIDCPRNEVQTVVQQATKIMLVVKTPVEIPMAVEVKIGSHL